MKQLASVIITVLMTIAAILIVWQLRTIVFLFLFSILVAATVRYPIEQLIKWRWPRWAALTLAYTVLFALLFGLAIIISIPLAAEAESLATTIANKYEIGYGFIQSDGIVSSRFTDRLPTAELMSQFLLGDQESNFASHFFVVTQNFLWWLSEIFLALVISVYWSADEWHFERLWLSLLPPQQRARMRELWRKVEYNVGAYLRSEIAQSVLAGAILTVGFWLLDAPYPFTMATLGALAWFIPVAGALLGIPLIALFVLLNSTWVNALIFVLFTIAIYSILEFLIEPRLYDRSNHSTLPVFVTMMVMVELYGLIGLIMAPPLTLALQLGFEKWGDIEKKPELEKEVALQDIADQLSALQGTVAIQETSPSYVVNMTKRLQELFYKTTETEKSTST